MSRPLRKGVLQPPGDGCCLGRSSGQLACTNAGKVAAHYGVRMGTALRDGEVPPSLCTGEPHAGDEDHPQPPRQDTGSPAVRERLRAGALPRPFSLASRSTARCHSHLRRSQASRGRELRGPTDRRAPAPLRARRPAQGTLVEMGLVAIVTDFHAFGDLHDALFKPIQPRETEDPAQPTLSPRPFPEAIARRAPAGAEEGRSPCNGSLFRWRRTTAQPGQPGVRGRTLTAPRRARAGPLRPRQALHPADRRRREAPPRREHIPPRHQGGPNAAGPAAAAALHVATLSARSAARGRLRYSLPRRRILTPPTTQPENVVFDESYNAILTDFGSAIYTPSAALDQPRASTGIYSRPDDKRMCVCAGWACRRCCCCLRCCCALGEAG